MNLYVIFGFSSWYIICSTVLFFYQRLWAAETDVFKLNIFKVVIEEIR